MVLCLESILFISSSLKDAKGKFVVSSLSTRKISKGDVLLQSVMAVHSSILYGDKFKTRLDPTQRELNRDSIHDQGTIRDWIRGKGVVRRHAAPAIQQTINNTKTLHTMHIFLLLFLFAFRSFS